MNSALPDTGVAPFEWLSNSKAIMGSKIGPRTRVAIWAILLSFVCGAIEFGEPLEDVLKGARDLVRLHDSNGKILVVGIDDRTGAALNGFGYSRKIDAAVVDELFRLGAKRVFFDKTYAFPTTPQDDAAFATALRRYPGRVYLGAASPIDPKTRLPVTFRPFQALRSVARVASLNGMQTPFALSAKLTTGDVIGGTPFPSLSYAIGNRTFTHSEYYRPDWSIRASTIPTLSFIDLVNKDVRADTIQGRDILLGPTATSLGDIRELVFQGFIPGVYLHAVGAETLGKGTPVNFGWLPAWACGLVLSALALRLTSARANVVVTLAAAIIFLALPVLLDSWLVTVDIVPGLLLFAIVGTRASTIRRIRKSATTNILTGRPNLVALHEEIPRTDKTVVALKLRNLAEIAASFNIDIEAKLVSELCRRIELSGNLGTIHHSADMLVWLTDQPFGTELIHHLEGLHRLSMKSIMVEGRDVDVSLSFGIDTNQERLLASRMGSAVQCADEAARENDVWKFYDQDRLHEAAWSLSLMSRLDHAIDTGELFVVYQPKMDLKTGRMIGAEALVRWLHPERGVIGPDDFIPAAEEHQRIEKLTEFVLDCAVGFARQMALQGFDFSIAVNVSTQLLGSTKFPLFVRQALERYKLPAAKLTLEVTETGRIDLDVDRGQQLQSYRDIGVQTSVDDFGSGHATYERLRSLKCNEVKIDKQFIKSIDTVSENQTIVRGTVALAKTMKMRVVAEGIETAAELAMCRKLGCDYAQGYFVSRPVDASTMEEFLEQKANVWAARAIG